MTKYSALVLLALSMAGIAMADVYLHNPRGSNGRYNENKRNRNNANRLFDSQNNARGGYNVGNLYYYVGSRLQIEWTNQHSCGSENNHCDQVIQYMCGDKVRDGTTTSTIPSNPTSCKNNDCDNDLRYGMHEDFNHYHGCRLRKRNAGLFAADQGVKVHASSTRQNRNARRYGYECAEEKDYYPNWHPSPWKDIVVMTNDVSRCSLYTAESQNVKEKFACYVDPAYLYEYSTKQPANNNYIPITEEECLEFSYTVGGEAKNGTWKRYDSHGIAAPRCMQSQYSRDNHNGNGVGGQTLSFNWTIPNDVHENCVLRIRYNISTGDYDRDNTTSAQNNRGRRNELKGPDVYSRYGLTATQGKANGFQLKQDPTVNIFGTSKFLLQLAIDTAQFGRTFQDRSHRFAIRPRPPSISADAKIININVRGKRGNIVQNYPAVEYDFVPNTAVVTVDDYVHFQWTGSDNNPGNNAGQGRASTDRSNVVMLKTPAYVEGDPETCKQGHYGQLGRSYPSRIDDLELGGLSAEVRKDLAILRPTQFGGEMIELDDAGTYFDQGAQKVTMAGQFNYMCTRNNNFSNRSQKAKLIVTNSEIASDYIDQQGGSLALDSPEDDAATEVMIPPGSLTQGQPMEIQSIPEGGMTLTGSPANTAYVSDFVRISPEGTVTQSGNPMHVTIRLNEMLTSFYKPEIFKSSDGGATWVKVDHTSHTSQAVTFMTDTGGHFVVSKMLDSGTTAGLAIGLLVAVLIIIALAVLLHKNRSLLSSYKSKV